MSTSSFSNADRIGRLLERAFAQGPAREANQLMYDMRQRFGARALNYEVVLQGPAGEQRGWDYLEQIVLPRLALLARSKRMSPKSESIFVSLFMGEELYFIAASELYDCYREISGLDGPSFESLLSQWQRMADNTTPS